MVTELAPILAASAATLGVAVVSLWLLSVALKDASIVDIFWGLGFVVVGWVAFLLGEGEPARKALICGAVTAWGLRLAGYLAWRNIGSGEDPRYQRMRRHHGDAFWRISLVTVFGLQGVLIFIVSLPLQAAQAIPGPPLGPLDFLGAGLVATGLFFETVGDIQLARFRGDPANAGQVMDRGLWRYTYH